MAEEFDLAGFTADLKETLKNSKNAFKGKYKDQLNELAGLSRNEIDAISPGIEDLQKYDALMTVVKEASRVNLEQAELTAQIRKLGSIAVTIAKKVPSLAALFH